MHDHDEVPTRREFILGGSAALGSLSGLGALRGFRSAQVQGCPTGNVGPINCAPPAGYNNPVKWVQDTSLPMRTRWSAFDPAGAANIAKLQRAYAAMRRLTVTNPRDPRGWLQQANVHCWYCGGGQNGNAGPEIHGGWWFFPWHRCYLYFHERALASLIKDPTVSLAYWNWDSVTTTDVLRVPPAFYTGSLVDTKREAVKTDVMPSAYVSGLSPSDPHLLANGTLDWFGDDPTLNPSQNNSGVLESGPHGVVHLWTGAAHELSLCTKSPPGGKPDMGVLATAAQDPVFYAHHTNIDRLWDVWLAYQAANNTGDGNPSWPVQSWTFYNANLDGTGQWVTMSVSDVIDHARTLSYQYAPPPGPALLASVSAGARQQQEQQPTSIRVRPHTQSVDVPAGVRSSLGAVDRAVQQAGRNLLHVELEMSSNDGAIVHVFGNFPNATARTSTDHKNFLGYFAIVPKGGREHMMAHDITIDITHKLHLISGPDDPLTITLVPRVEGQTASQMRILRVYLVHQD